MDEINLTNSKHVENIFKYLIEHAEETWLGDVTLACADGTIKLNRLTVGLIFPELEKCQVFSLPTDVLLIIPEFTQAEVRWKIQSSEKNRNKEASASDSDNDGDDYDEAYCDGLNTSEHVQYNHVTMQCQICKESQPSWVHLTEHIKIHVKTSNVSGLACPKCSKTFPTQVLLDNHFTSYHSVKKRYICEECGKSFESNSKLSDHNNIHHLKVKPYNCKECSYSASALQTLNHHVKAVHIGLKFTCSVCGKVFSHRGTLTTHERTHSESRTTYPCTFEFCGKVYVKKNSLRDHIDECHSSPKCLKCEFCTSEFKCHRSLKTHMKVHDESTALKCTLCDKRFSTNQQLTYHMNSHTGNKPFKCEYCSSCYSSHSSLYHHKKSCIQKSE